MHAARHQRREIDPERILHAAAHDGAAVPLGQGVQLIGDSRGCGPGEERFFRRGNHADAPGDAFQDGLVHIRQKALQRQHRDVGVASVQHGVGVLLDFDSRGLIQAHDFADVPVRQAVVSVDGAYDLRALLQQIPHDDPAHFPAAVLDHPNLVPCAVIHGNHLLFTACAELGAIIHRFSPRLRTNCKLWKKPARRRKKRRKYGILLPWR